MCWFCRYDDFFGWILAADAWAQVSRGGFIALAPAFRLCFWYYFLAEAFTASHMTITKPSVLVLSRPGQLHALDLNLP
jgi:hypothetical protein